MTRIFLDCSNIRLDGLPTGVPRVVANYINCGQRWAAAHGHEFIAVLPSAHGLLPAQRYVIRNRRRSLVKLPRPALGHTLMHQLNMAYVYLADRLRLLVFHSLMSCALVLPVPHRSAERAASWLAKQMGRALAVPKRSLDRLLISVSRISVRPGDVLFCPAYWHDVDSDIYKELSASGCRISFLVHDLLPITHPQHYPFPWRDEFRQRLSASFSHVVTYFCVSRQTRESLTQFAASIGMAEPRTRISHNGLDPLADVATAKPSKDLAVLLDKVPRFLMMVGSIEPKKNHLYVVDQLSALWQQGYATPLVIVGRRGWMDQEIVERLRRHPEFGTKLLWLDRVTDKELALLYKRAIFLVFASEAEGFGLPLIEALSNGLPVLAYDSDIAREVAGDLGVYFDRNRSNLGDLLREYSNDEAYRALRSRVDQFRWPSWAEVTEAVFEELVRPAETPERAATPSMRPAPNFEATRPQEVL